MIDNYLKAENLGLRHRSIRNEISKRGRKRVRYLHCILNSLLNFCKESEL